MTNPTISAETRAHIIVPSCPGGMAIGKDTAAHSRACERATEQIRQAEQAAYERAAKWHDKKAAECDARFGMETVSSAMHRRDAAAIRALAQEPEEVG